MAMTTVASRRSGVFTLPADDLGGLVPAASDHGHARDRGGDAHVRRGPPGLVGDPQQQRHDDPVGDERRAAVRDERRHQAGHRDDPRDAADHDERLQRDDEREAAGEQLAEPVADADRGAEAALRQDQVAHQDRDESGQAELLTERRDDEVRLRERHEVGRPLPQPGAEQPAAGHAEQAADQLAGAAVGLVEHRRVERVQPGVEPGADVLERARGQPRADDEQQEADDHPGQPLGGQVEHRDEQTEEQQRRAQVALEDEDGDRRGPHDEDRAEVPRPGQVQAEHLGSGQRERVAVRHQVAGEEDRERDLGELGGLEARPRRRAPRSARR